MVKFTPNSNHFNGLSPEIQTEIFHALVRAYHRGQADIVETVRLSRTGAEQSKWPGAVQRQWGLFGIDHAISVAEVKHLESLFEFSEDPDDPQP